MPGWPLSAITKGASIQIDVSDWIARFKLKDAALAETQNLLKENYPQGNVMAVLLIQMAIRCS